MCVRHRGKNLAIQNIHNTFYIRSIPKNRKTGSKPSKTSVATIQKQNAACYSARLKLLKYVKNSNLIDSLAFGHFTG